MEATGPPSCDDNKSLPAALDADDMLARRDEDRLAHLCAESQSAVQKRRHHAEEIVVCEYLLQEWQGIYGMEVDATQLDPTELAERRRIVLCHAAALEGTGRRREATDALRMCLGVGEEWLSENQEFDEYPSIEVLDVTVALALAKLYFKDNRKDRAMTWCDAVLQKLRYDSDIQPENRSYSVEDAADAYHLAGWVRIHADDHSGAYKLWTEGHAAVPECQSLARQYRKRECWDSDTNSEVCDPRLLGDGAHGDGVFRSDDLEAFVVPEANAKRTPALALFDQTTQRNALVFRSRRPVLTPTECQRVVDCVETFHEEHRGGEWGTVRHSSVKTTDVAVEDIPALRPWLRDLLRTRLYPLVAAAYPRLADGSTPGEMGSRIRVHDAFIVRYDADHDGSISLPEHSDTSAVSFTVALNSSCQSSQGLDDDDESATSDGAFEGGGTWFEALGSADMSGKVVDAQVGHAIAFAGPLRHAGYPVTRGCRVILVLFLYVDGFPYGRYLREYAEQHKTCDPCLPADDSESEVGGDGDRDSQDVTKPSGDMPGGFVVYNQTVELVGMLNRRVDSVLD
jgi:hypothetical protein